MPLRRTLILLAALSVAGAALFGAAQAASPLPKAGTPVLLEVTGKIRVTNEGEAARFDRDMLNALPQHRLETYTDWTEGPQVFEGPLLADVLERVGAYGSTLRATALNDYRVEIPRADSEAYPVVLALRQNGAPMSVRDKGPIWIIYPNATPESALASPHNDKSVWQLRSLDVR